MSQTTAYPYSFDSMSRIGNDNVNIDQRSVQNMNGANHHLENFYPACPMNKAIDFALAQPNVFYKGAHEGGIKGYLSVPYLGRGLGDPEEEFRIRTGQCDLNKKTVNNMMELNFSDHKNYPLMDSLQTSVDNSAYKIESDAMDGWVRGGMSAREFARSQDDKH